MYEYVRIYETLHQSFPDDDLMTSGCLWFIISSSCSMSHLYLILFYLKWAFLEWDQWSYWLDTIQLSTIKIEIVLTLFDDTTPHRSLNRWRERKPLGCFHKTEGGYGIYVIDV